MRQRKLGRGGPIVSALGLGCMGMSDFYGGRDESEAIATLERAVEMGVTFFDTADVYGPHTNEKLVGRVLRPHRDRITLATKFGLIREAGQSATRVNGRPDYVATACEASLRRLGADVIDLYYLHRVDPETPIEETVAAMARLVEAGKVRFLGLSEVHPATLRKAHAIHPITAVQSEYSLWTRDPEDGILAACRELGVGFVPFCPLGRGFLTGQIRRPDQFEAGDYRQSAPRFQEENFAANLRLVERLRDVARQKHCTAAQLALAWVLAQGEEIVPIPGTKRRRYLQENLGALEVHLTSDDLAQIEELAPRDAFHGPRYPETMMQMVNR